MTSKISMLIPGNNIKTLLLSVVFLLFFLFAAFSFPVSVRAQSEELLKEMNSQTQAFSGKQGADLGTAQDPRLIAARIINGLLGLLGILTVAYIVYGGYLILLAQGNEEEVSKGKEAIKNAAIGLALILSAYSIARFAVRFATGDEQKQDDYCQVLTDKSGFYNNDKWQQDTVPFSPELYKDCIKGD